MKTFRDQDIDLLTAYARRLVQADQVHPSPTPDWWTVTGIGPEVPAARVFGDFCSCQGPDWPAQYAAGTPLCAHKLAVRMKEEGEVE